MNKTISSMNKTMRLTNMTQNTKKFSIGNSPDPDMRNMANRLPAINRTQIERREHYINEDLNDRSAKRLRQVDSKTTLNVMNMTFNSRPGVKDFIAHLIGPG